MNDPRILIAESGSFSPEALRVLKEIGSVSELDLDREGLYQAVGQADILWVRLRHRIDESILSAASRLKVLVTPTTGLNHVDTGALSRRGVQLISLRGETAFLKNVRATAEHTIALMLAILRRLPQANEQVRRGGWNRDELRGHELYGKKVGIVGYGRLGEIVARYLRAFEAFVLVSDPKLMPGSVADGVTAVGLEQLLRESDIVSLHVNLRAETSGFFNRALFNQMKWGSCFINTARGELIDEAALLESLGCGRISAAALDVLANEDSGGMSKHALVEYARLHDNLIITPHIGGCTVESQHKTELFLAEKLRALLQEQSAVFEAAVAN